jgi:23S rRNA (cytosine1962-C5)-methyltransferase
MLNPKIILKSGKDSSIRRFHHWVFSGAIKQVVGEVEDGALVEVYDNKDNFLALGHFQNGSIRVRILSFEERPIDQAFWNEAIEGAVALRRRLGLLQGKDTNVCRLVHGEGDALPGLIVDYYHGLAVIQAHSVGMFHAREAIAEALKQALGPQLDAIYDKSRSTLNLREFPDFENGFLWGDRVAREVQEAGRKFWVDVAEGQKTGFFVDQRENRRLLASYAEGKRVLNTFAYTGGFSIYALSGGATRVDSVESSQSACEVLERNLQLNAIEPARHQTLTEDAFGFLDEMANDQYDLIVLDPPAFAKHRGALRNALKGYRRINQRAFEKVSKGGIIFTFSCSQVVSKQKFREAVFTAAALAGRRIRILHQLHQPIDHPINIYHPEGEYLKGLVLSVD